MEKIYKSGEDYLEIILFLQKKNGSVRSIDIAREMNYSKPSISRAVKILKTKGFILIDENGYITFTDIGKKHAETIYERHVVLTDWLISIGVNEKTAAEDACLIEHDISNETFEKLKIHINNTKGEKNVHKKS